MAFCKSRASLRYLHNSVVIENQTEPYTAAMAQLATKTDILLVGTDPRQSQTPPQAHPKSQNFQSVRPLPVELSELRLCERRRWRLANGAGD
jgi:hypothetical protein